MSDSAPSASPDFRPPEWAILAAVVLTVVAFAVLIAVVIAARHSIRAELPPPTAKSITTGPKTYPYNPLQDELRQRFKQVTWTEAATAMAASTGYMVLMFVAMVWVARDARRRGMRSGTWAVLYLVGHLVFSTAAVSFLIFPAVLPYALPVLPLGWIGLAVYFLLRRPAPDYRQ